MRIITVIIFLFFLQSSALAQYHFEYDRDLSRIYQLIINLELNQAKSELKTYNENHPYNLASLHVENYVDFFEIFITENQERFKTLESNKKIRINKIKKNADQSSPYKNYAIAEIELQWALIRSKFNELFKAGREILHAYQLLEENKKQHPDFIYSYKSLSIIHSLIETISLPGLIKNLFGIKGTIQEGISEINAVLEYSQTNEFVFDLEAQAIYAYILFYQSNKKEEAWKFVCDSDLNNSQSPLAKFIVVKMAQRNGQNELALSLLESRVGAKASDSFYYLDFLTGLSKLRKLDPGANMHFEKYLQNFEGQHFIKEAHQKLAWYELAINNNFAGYKKHMADLVTAGNKLIDDDKQAQREAEANLLPHPILLQARLLYDGGYYTKAYEMLIREAYLFDGDQRHQLEYYYRLGRLTHALKNYRDAIQYYGYSLNIGQNKKSYFACNSALQIGLIYESQGDAKSAKRYFNKCLQLHPEEYKNSLHQKAKSGLNRIKS